MKLLPRKSKNHEHFFAPCPNSAKLMAHVSYTLSAHFPDPQTPQIQLSAMLFCFLLFFVFCRVCLMVCRICCAACRPREAPHPRICLRCPGNIDNTTTNTTTATIIAPVSVIAPRVYYCPACLLLPRVSVIAPCR